METEYNREKGSQADSIGQIVYFSLSRLLVKKDILEKLCKQYDIPCMNVNRIAASDAFRSATSSVNERVLIEVENETQIGKVFFRDNCITENSVSKELVLEIMGSKSNRYIKLANVTFDRKNQSVSYGNIRQDTPVDVLFYCRTVSERFMRFRQCAGRKKIETICTNYLSRIQATKLGGNAHLYFVPAFSKRDSDRLLDFLRAVDRESERNTALSAIWFPLTREKEQCDQIALEFVAALRKEIVKTMERAEYFLCSDSQSPSIMERWILRINKIENKYKNYEKTLGTQLVDLDDEIEKLRELSQELEKRADMIQIKRAA